MTKFSILLAVVAAQAVATFGADGSLRASVQQALEAETQGNDPICNQIRKSQWWADRKAEKNRPAITALDTQCAQFTNNPDKCNYKNARDQRSEDADIACTMVGANNHRCIANPCNHYNTGRCGVQWTAGKCVWWTPSQIKSINRYYKANNVMDPFVPGKVKQIPGNGGCFRNPCDSPGYRNSPRQECNAGEGIFKVDGVYECTWCQINGQGMGCQMKTFNGNSALETPSDCRPVNQKSGNLQDSVYVLVDKPNCQCSIGYTYCDLDVNGRSSDFKKKTG